MQGKVIYQNFLTLAFGMKPTLTYTLSQHGTNVNDTADNKREKKLTKMMERGEN